MYDSSCHQHDPQHGGGAILDSDTIAALLELGGEDDPELLLELVDLFLGDAAERMQTLTAAWGGGDLETVARAAHALKSASANIGALCFSGACKEVELAAKAGEGERVADPVARCRDMFPEVQAALRALREAA